MTRPPEPSGEDAASILRAIGSLLVALSGNTDPASPSADATAPGTASSTPPRREDPPPPAPSEPRRRPARPARPPREYVPTPQTVREVDFILTDARERARQILDESMGRAQTLLRPDLNSVPGIDPRAFEDLRQATRGLATEIRDVQRRLSRIEALLRASSAARPYIDPYVEQGLPLVRVANTGVSAVVDAKGRVLSTIPLGEAAFLDAPLPPALAPTPYARWGDGPVLGLLAASIAAVALAAGRKRA